MGVHLRQRSARLSDVDDLVNWSELFGHVYAATPWPTLMFGDDGSVLGASDECGAGSADDASAAETPLRERARHYLAALRGAVPWLTPQVAESVRALPSGAVVYERIHLRLTDWGSCLSVIDQTELRLRPEIDPQTARLAALGFMVAGVCHEVSNPLTSLHSIVQILRAEKHPSRELLDKGLNNIAVNVQRILDISRRLVTFARVGDEPRSRFAVDEAIEEALYVLRHEGLLQHVVLLREAEAKAVIVANIGQVREIILNLLINAVQAMDGHGTLQIATRCAGAAVEVLVTDSGPGVPESHRARIFEPFFTTKAESRGTGLGLAISNEIAFEHGGTIELLPGEGAGASFRIVLPGAPA